MPARILVVDDDSSTTFSLELLLRDEGYEVRSALSARDAKDLLAQHWFDLVFLDLRLPDADGIELLAHIKQLSPETEIVLMTAHGSLEVAIEAIKLGAFYYVEKPFTFEQLLSLTQRALQFKEIKAESRGQKNLPAAEREDFGIVGNNMKLRQVRTIIRTAAPSDASVLIEGESGTGKELIATALHVRSERAARPFIRINCAASQHVGLHPQMVFFDVTRSDGMNVGFNPVQTAAPGTSVSYQWYAGDVVTGPNNTGVPTPIELGASTLSPSDPIKHTNKGAIGGLIIEPKGSQWNDTFKSRAQVDITRANGTIFREFVTIFQNDVNLRFNGMNGEATTENGIAVPNLAQAEDPEDSGQKAVNYRTEPLWKRMGFAPDTPLEKTRDFDFTNVLTNAQVGGQDPVTPVFTAAPGQEIRVRMLHPCGHPRNDTYLFHAHIWEQEPYRDESQVIGSNPLSNWVGAQGGVGPGGHFDFLPKGGAGGRFRVPGDYLYRTFTSFHFDGGIWAILRVSPNAPPPSGCQPCPPGVFCTDVCVVAQ